MTPEDTAFVRVSASARAGDLAITCRKEGWEVPHLLDYMETAPDFYFDSVSQIRMDRWSQRRIALLVMLPGARRRFRVWEPEWP